MHCPLTDIEKTSSAGDARGCKADTVRYSIAGSHMHDYGILARSETSVHVRLSRGIVTARPVRSILCTLLVAPQASQELKSHARHQHPPASARKQSAITCLCVSQPSHSRAMADGGIPPKCSRAAAVPRSSARGVIERHDVTLHGAAGRRHCIWDEGPARGEPA